MKIQILAACHKASVLPDNELFVPIQVGAARAPVRLPMIGDDTGENISQKNPGYCELTAQYWGWKHLDADYLGLCHYRRFLCFARTQDRRNERDQIVASSLNPFNIRKFGLEDVAQMRMQIEAADVVTGMPQNVAKLYTPRGVKHTAYAHWAAHDRDLIRREDLDRMLEILSDVSPEVGAWAYRYLHGRWFGGFNCFVMKRELYRELCEIEFETLFRLEVELDRSYYSTQMNRVFGFLGEIISSAYIDYLEKKKHFRVKHVPLLFFESTEPTIPNPPIRPEVIAVLFCAADALDVLFCAQLRSFLTHTEKSRRYDVWIWIRARTETRRVLSGMTADYPNVHLYWIDADLLTRELAEQYGGEITALPLLPFVMPAYARMLFFGSNLLFLDSVTALWNTTLEVGELLAAPRDLWMVARYNDIFPQTEAQYLDKQLENPFDYVTDKVVVWDLAAYRRALTPEAVCAVMKNSRGDLRNPAELINVLCQGKIRILPQKWCVWPQDDAAAACQLTYLPARYAEEWKNSTPCILYHTPQEPFFPKGALTDLTFWHYARQTPLYESCLAHMSYVVSTPFKEDPMETLKRRIKNRGAVGRFLARTFPKGSAGYRFAHWLLRKITR